MGHLRRAARLRRTRLVTGFASYVKVTSEPKETKIRTMEELLQVLMEAGFGQRVRIEVFDAQGHRHDVGAEYLGESTGLARAGINHGRR